MKEWLTMSVEDRLHPFAVATYAEKVGWASAGAADEMAALLAKSTTSPEVVEHMSRRVGWDKGKARSRYVAERQPTRGTAKKGKFGEVLHEAVLEQFCGMLVICRRYRYMYSPSPDTPPPGLDIIALAPLADGGEVIVYAETKLRTGTGGGSALADALRQLAETQGVDDPPSLKSTMQYLRDADPLLYKRVLRAVANKNCRPHHRVGGILEAKHWSDAHLRQLKGVYDGIRDMILTVDVVKISSLDALIEESYSNAGRSDG